MKKLCIVQEDDGTVKVGLEPMGDGMDMEGMGEDYLEPADSLNAAFARGRELLAGEPDPEDEKAFGDGFEQVANPMMMNARMGGMKR